MVKRLSFAAAMLATVAVASPSFAQSFSFTANPSRGAGSVTLRQTTSVRCEVTITVIPQSPGYATIFARNILMGDSLCLAVAPYGFWEIAVVPSSTSLIAVTVGANTVTNRPCYGTVVATWNNTTSTVTFLNNVVPPVNPSDPSCTILNGSVRIPGLHIIP